MVAIVRLEEYEKLAYTRHFSEKTTGRRTGDNRNPNSYQVQREKTIFFKFAQQGFLSSDWHICSNMVFKGHTGAIICDTGLTGNGTSILGCHWL
ncbi:hypothetical protein [Clostridium sp. E02]|uniref:hypothetical protein n=1 Tax=Clostridium sp. E02 TaxID=2487134 RepID=UPI000F544B11|nr:hypothetical protein [Clostridium sp. E02]